MTHVDLNLLRYAAAVDETGSFSGAARRFGVPRSTVSRAVAALEDQLGVLLFQRTTRSVQVTSAGVELFADLGSKLRELEHCLEETRAGASDVSGVVKVSATADLGSVFLADVALRYCERYPGASVDLRLTNELVDLVRDGFDLALRIAVRPAAPSSHIVRKVGAIQLRLYAAPSYLARNGTPRAARDLEEHAWAVLVGDPMDFPPFKTHGRAAPRGPKHVRVKCDDMFFMREFLVKGGGVGSLPHFLGDPLVASGQLVRVLPSLSTYVSPVFLVSASRRHLPRRVLAFRELLIERLKALTP